MKDRKPELRQTEGRMEGRRESRKVADALSYLSQSDADALSLISVMSDDSFVMRADAENQAAGRGRNSVRISGKDKFADVSFVMREGLADGIGCLYC